MHRTPTTGSGMIAAAPGRLMAALLAGTLPPLLAYNLPPSPTLLNQCLAVALWGGFVIALMPGGLPLRGRALFAAIAVMAAAVLWSGTAGALPSALTLSALALLAGAAALAWAGSDAARRPDAPAIFGCFAAGLAAAGLLSAGVALVQVFAPDWTDGNVIAHSGLVGRAVGNLRQPNHLCSLLLWGVVGAIGLFELRGLGRAATIALVVLLVFAVELSASRTGALGLVLLALWGLLDRRLSGTARVLLIATPLIYGLSYGAMALYGQWSHQAIGAEARIAAGEATGIDSPNSRPRIWANALSLIAQQPWFGVGFGEFNLAWSLTPFPGRPTAFFDHTHTLPLQLAVELGVPLAALVLGLMVFALWQAWQRSQRADGDAGVAARSAWMLVLLTGLHSLFEYPLWYAYFLLPVAFAWGFALGAPSGEAASAARPKATAWPGTVVGGLLVLGGALAMLDYMRVVAIYAPGTNAGPLQARIGSGQHSVLFAHHADYAAATSADPLPGSLLAFRRAPHYLMDTRLMLAWTRHLAANGQLDRARALAARLREFRNADSDEFFAPCQAGDTQAFQCQPPQAPHGWREFTAE
ncbi:PglL family O-oligosaccharyltransferase [Aquabacterium sp.]|uniref:PglL family O-oligosaccharyltransferase n=1 Tax=Aquabacterium sp. TaxID=1872578 RepID=UPI002C7C36B6|nr:Wzy polymerase domain-containing protein [Aquabacterium sp.]HSW08634.1 Wzy polymerase domain-containing protein [Aquabacterium sp.]